MWQGCKKIFLVFFILIFSVPGYAQQIRVGSVRYASEADRAKIIFDVTSSPKHRVFVLDNPSRLVIDVKNAQANRKLSQPSASHPLFAHVRAAAKNDTDLRIVIDLKQNVTAKSHKLATNNSDSQHLIIDLLNKNSATVVDKGKQTTEKLAYSKSSDRDEQTGATTKTSSSKSKRAGNKKQRFVIAIDAGHGGDDPGARGPNGTHEKQVTLAIAKKLEALINGQPGMKAKMVRKGDYYVGLRERMKIARLAKADLFICIHANSMPGGRAIGTETYVMGLHKEESNFDVAKRENSVILMDEDYKERYEGFDPDSPESYILFALTQTAYQESSLLFAKKVEDQFRARVGRSSRGVKQAGFLVLWKTTMPSVLIETGFLSHSTEELFLAGEKGQDLIASGIYRAFKEYKSEVESIN